MSPTGDGTRIHFLPLSASYSSPALFWLSAIFQTVTIVQRHRYGGDIVHVGGSCGPDSVDIEEPGGEDEEERRLRARVGGWRWRCSTERRLGRVPLTELFAEGSLTPLHAICGFVVKSVF